VAHHGNSVSLWTVGEAASPDEALATERSGSQVPLAQSIRCLASVRLRGDALVLRSAASSDLSTLGGVDARLDAPLLRRATGGGRRGARATRARRRAAWRSAPLLRWRQIGAGDA
jgi:hypothetical protein